MDQQTLNQDRIKSLLTLSLVPGIGPKTTRSLLDYFDDPETVLSAQPDQLRQVSGVGPKLAREISLATKTIRTDSYLELCEKNQIAIRSCFDADYPKSLIELPNPPTILYQYGTMVEEDTLALAIVGSRHATPYGKRVAEQLARGLASAGYTIVSGLARGIDACAHRGAIAAGGRTIGVLASGLLNIYPAEHAELAGQVRECGALLSESAPNHPPKGGSFPQRNRIISGLSLGTIGIAADQRSGALITARLAAEQRREVFAIPGPIDSRMSKGCHQLIRDGAKLVESVDDVLEELGPLAKPITAETGEAVFHPGELKLNEQERSVLDATSVSPTDIDSIIAATGLPASRILATISVLEVRRLIRRVSGNQIVRAGNFTAS